jgi:hypothetical protein
MPKYELYANQQKGSTAAARVAVKMVSKMSNTRGLIGFRLWR